ncbi:MAG: hypothetical protein KDE47_05280, partial [Caldilineaceae bacterium]|nr:hypothetical protein [Caldilineaceae bacterium]
CCDLLAIVDGQTLTAYKSLLHLNYRYTATVWAIQASVLSGEAGSISCRCHLLIIYKNFEE